MLREHTFTFQIIVLNLSFFVNTAQIRRGTFNIRFSFLL